MKIEINIYSINYKEGNKELKAIEKLLNDYEYINLELIE